MLIIWYVLLCTEYQTDITSSPCSGDSAVIWLLCLAQAFVLSSSGLSDISEYQLKLEAGHISVCTVTKI